MRKFREKIRTSLAVALLAVVAVVQVPAAAHAQNEIADIAGIFIRSVADYYGIPSGDIYGYRDRGILDEELPVVYHLARAGDVDPDCILERRLAGDPWYAIARELGLNPDIFYVDVPAYYDGPDYYDRPPYGRAYGYWKKHPRSEWHLLELSDREVVDLVNLRFVSERYDYDPVYVIRERSAGKTFVTINSDLSRKPGRVYVDRGKPDKASKQAAKSAAKAEKKATGKPADSGQARAKPAAQKDHSEAKGHGEGHGKNKAGKENHGNDKDKGGRGKAKGKNK